MGWNLILSPHDDWLDVIFFVVVSVGCALLGWGVVYLASRIEHERRERLQNAKIRDGILDVKRLQQVDVNGLELWEPVLKAIFPLSQNDVAAAFLEWQLSLPELGRKIYTIDQFTNELIAAQPHLRVAAVTKSRRRFSFAGCIAEFVRLSVDSLYLDSFSLEHAQTGPIVEALNDLGLVNVSNINYPLALKRALGLEGDTQNSNRQGAARA
jgi:exopolyphosphatase / guanosine-5'-triphosphate,3'-diphosphate pyrophosphatase